MWLRIWAFLDWCFFGPASARPGLLGATLRLLRYPYAVLRDLSRGEINLRAMGLVYTTLLSIIPLLAFSFAILKIFGARRDLEPVVFEFFRPLGTAAAQELTTRVLAFAGRVSSGLVGSLGLALLVWTLVGTIKKVEDSFNFLWHVEQPRSFARRLAEYTGFLIAAPVILVGFVGLLHATLAAAPVQEVVNLPLLQRLRGVGIVLAPFAMVTGFFTALYMLIPNTRVHWRAAFTG
ncbi:MAG TPA: YihY/virulence factor BrkB family protein, partial [Steroidobacteraceae bacterium]|nr:YihY/virulence factor BrkB family protein [Steroidobacteraceae bacterium]